MRVAVTGGSHSGDDGDATDVELSNREPAMVSKSSSRMRAWPGAAASDDGSAQFCSLPENSGGEGGREDVASRARRSTRQRIARVWSADVSAWTPDSDEDASDDEGNSKVRTSIAWSQMLILLHERSK